MHRPILILVFLAALIQSYETQQIQMPEAGAMFQPDDEDLATQVQELKKNLTELWTYIYTLRSSVTSHLNHLKQHQIELENTVHRLEYHGEGHGETHAAHTDDHHHSGEHHSHSDEQHSHGDTHGDDQHQHSDEHHSHSSDSHSHGDDSHSHGDDSHSHGDDSHSHAADYHSHSTSSHSHSHTSDGSHSGHGHAEHHHGDHKDSHENEDDLQQTQQGADLVVEPVIVRGQRPKPSHPHPPSTSSGIAPLNEVDETSHYHHHHHHHDHGSSVRNRSRTVVMPKSSESFQYDFAVCNVQPNRGIPEESQQEIVGQISLWQKKRGGPLNIHISVKGFQMDHGDHGGNQQLQQEEDNETPDPLRHKHGFHVHSFGDLSNGCQSTGPHYNPKAVNHGGPSSLIRHVGDLGNIECDEHGVANIVFSDDIASLKGPYSIIGKSMVIHSNADDFGLGGNEESLRTGNAGTRLACCVIEKAEKLPIRSYRAIKTASQYKNY